MAEEMALTAGQVRDLSTQMKTLAERTKAFDKNVDELTASLRVLDGVQKDLLKRSSNLEKAANRADKAVEQAKKSYEAFRTQTGQGALDATVQEQERLRQALQETGEAIQSNRTAYQKLTQEAGQADSWGIAGGGSFLRQLQKAGVFNPLGEAVGQAATAFLGSALGESASATAGGLLSGAAKGYDHGGTYGT